MYDPIGNAIEREAQGVIFTEYAPPDHLRAVVHRFLHIRTDRPLLENHRFHALPDACTYLIFDQTNPDICGLTRLQASSEELSLGRAFNYLNIRLLPGVWQGDRALLSYGLINRPYTGPLPLKTLNARLATQDIATKLTTLTTYVEDLLANGLLAPNPVTEAIFSNIENIHSVADMAATVSLSTRQLQRVLNRSTGFAPHDFLKILRLQQSLLGEPSLSYADQSHFIHAFKAATGYTPGQYAKKFDV